jgi:dipeptidyl aminopeptidase/acylaminoacyl peptidase
MNKRLAILIGVVLIVAGAVGFAKNIKSNPQIVQRVADQMENVNDGGIVDKLNPLSIENLRNGEYPGSDLVIEQTLDSDTNYDRYIASFRSEGLKIYGLLTVPNGDKPESGWPVIIFNHGYISPAEYRTTERYIAYQDGFARNGYVTFKSDYRGHGSSEGQATGAYGSNSYTIDVLNSVASLKKYKDSDPERIGMWGHSLGGYITLRAMVINTQIKAGVIWAGVVASYPDLLNNWRRPGISPFSPPPGTRTGWRTTLVQPYGPPEENPTFWNGISANSYLSDLGGPIQIHHGTADSSVPVAFSEKLDKQIKEAIRTSELYVYEGDDHNLTNNFNTAMQRSIEFFDKQLK